MRSFAILFVFVLLSFPVFGKGKEAKVSFKKEMKKVSYTISMEKPFKINKDAPFKFYLKKGTGKNDVIKKVAFKDFSSDKKGNFTYQSKSGETDLYFWFIACKYKGKEVIACKTFTGKEKIK